MVFYNENVAINHDKPENALDVKGKLTLRNNNNKMTMWVDENTGNIMMRIEHENQYKEFVVLNFQSIK
jgi:hypothetical protein